jgi:hypothetical protein
MSSPRCKKNPQRERKKFLLINFYFFYFFYLLIIIIIIIIIINVCNQYLPELQYKAKSKCEVELYFLHVIVQYVCCILLVCWYTCNQSYIEQFFNLHISTLHPSAISSISFKNQVNMKYMQSVFPRYICIYFLLTWFLKAFRVGKLGGVIERYLSEIKTNYVYSFS